MIRNLEHLVFVRHGEGEGDVRRAAWHRGEAYITDKTPEEEELTALGWDQANAAGLYIAKYIVELMSMKFDVYLTSPSLRSEQTAGAMNLAGVVWNIDESLDERNRGLIRGLRGSNHAKLYPESFRQMKEDPLGWVPPGGESIRSVSDRTYTHLENIDNFKSVLAVTHRDLMWAAMQPIEELSDAELLAVDTDAIHNAQIIHYTSIDPSSGEKAPALMWKRTVDPTQSPDSARWQILENVSRKISTLALD